MHAMYHSALEVRWSVSLEARSGLVCPLLVKSPHLYVKPSWEEKLAPLHTQVLRGRNTFLPPTGVTPSAFILSDRPKPVGGFNCLKGFSNPVLYNVEIQKHAARSKAGGRGGINNQVGFVCEGY